MNMPNGLIERSNILMAHLKNELVIKYTVLSLIELNQVLTCCVVKQLYSVISGIDKIKLATQLPARRIYHLRAGTKTRCLLWRRLLCFVNNDALTVYRHIHLVSNRASSH
jgi:hypothetical protein